MFNKLMNKITEAWETYKPVPNYQYASVVKRLKVEQGRYKDDLRTLEHTVGMKNRDIESLTAQRDAARDEAISAHRTAEAAQYAEVQARKYAEAYVSGRHLGTLPTVAEIIKEMTPRVTVKLGRELDPINNTEVFTVDVKPEHVRFYSTFDVHTLRDMDNRSLAKEAVRSELWRNFERSVIPQLWASMNHAVTEKVN